MIRNHKPNVGTCECSVCGTLNPSAPSDHPHRNCSKVVDGVLHTFRSSNNRGTWRKISPDSYAEKLAAQTGGPTKDDLAEQDLQRSVTMLEQPPAPCLFLDAALRDAPIPAA